MYRSASEAFHSPRYFKPWQSVCVAETSAREDEKAWCGARLSDLTAAQLVKFIRKGVAR